MRSIYVITEVDSDYPPVTVVTECQYPELVARAVVYMWWLEAVVRGLEHIFDGIEVCCKWDNGSQDFHYEIDATGVVTWTNKPEELEDASSTL